MTRSASRAALLAAAAALAAGCASLPAAEEENGPSFAIGGSIAVRELGKPAQVVNFTWSRGPGYAGWEERIELTDRISGIQLAKALSGDGQVTVTARRRNYRADSLSQLFERLVGAPMEPAELAGWLENQRDGAPVPDSFGHSGLLVFVRDRHADGAPKTLQLLRGEDQFIVLVSDRDTSD